ncbi:MAG: hypothetical protein HQ591_08660 [candidate division Zixibacteria bacterium]|nr:hypothetical protein [Candidatus Tariuqbacter arcticus]
MYIVDLRNNIIHDAMNSKYECHIKDIPKDKIKKIYTYQSVVRMCASEHRPCFMGCQYCLSELYNYDMTKIFR